MRLIVCILVLAVTALDYRFGRTSPTVWIAGLATGGLLAISVIVDLMLPETAKHHQVPQDDSGD